LGSTSRECPCVDLSAVAYSDVIRSAFRRHSIADSEVKSESMGDTLPG
jgi:hypothetical protein